MPYRVEQIREVGGVRTVIDWREYRTKALMIQDLRTTFQVAHWGLDGGRWYMRPNIWVEWDKVPTPAVVYKPLTLSDTVNTKKSYLAWLESLSVDDQRLAAHVEEFVTSTMGAPVGRVHWREWVIAVVDRFEWEKAEQVKAYAAVKAYYQARPMSDDEESALIALYTGNTTGVDFITRHTWVSLGLRDLVNVSRRCLSDDGRVVAGKMWTARLSADESRRRAAVEYNAKCARRQAQSDVKYWLDAGAAEIPADSIGHTVFVVHLIDGWGLSADQAKRVISRLPGSGWNIDDAVKASAVFDAMDDAWIG
jgi:hypothetical protein